MYALRSRSEASQAFEVHERNQCEPVLLVLPLASVTLRCNFVSGD